MSFTSITVTGTYQNPDGSTPTGSVTFILTKPMNNGGKIQEPFNVTVALVGGAFSQALPANNDPGTLPSDAQYTVVEQLTATPAREYSIVVPYTAVGDTVDISTLDPQATTVFDGQGTDQFLSYITINDLKSWMQITSAHDDGTSDLAMERVVDMACTWAQRYCNRPLTKTLFAELHDGWSGSDIMVNKTPFLSLVSCTEYQSSFGVITLPEATPTSNTSVDAVQIDRSTGQIRRVFGGYSWPRTFFPGSRNISVTYYAGFDPVPPDVWLATVEYAAHWWRHTQQTMRGNMRGGSDPDPTEQQGGLWQGVPYRIIDLLDPFRMVSIG